MLAVKTTTAVLATTGAPPATTFDPVNVEVIMISSTA
jgi:hypothetical protein